MRYIIVFVMVFLLSGCMSNKNDISIYEEKVKSLGFSFVEGKVVGFLEDKIIVNINDNIEIDNSSYQTKLASKIMKSSLFIVGMNTFIGKEKAFISDVRANEVTFQIKNSKLKENQKVKIYIPKKTIAMMDFTLNSVNNESESFQLEDMVTKIIQSGQYIVVEREKLDLILKEQKLADSGLLNTNTASKIGKLVSADILLTGTFTEQGDYWSINARLVDVSTGVILVAINEKIALSEFKPSKPKDMRKDDKPIKIQERRRSPRDQRRPPRRPASRW